MSETELDTPVNPVDIAEQGSAALDGPESLRERLRRQRQESADNKTVDLPLPEYDNPQLVARYRLMETKELGQLGDRIRREYKSTMDRALYGAMDSIITCCIGLYARWPDSEELIPLGTEDAPIKFDQALAEYLGFEATTARGVVFETFGQNDFAIISHNVTLTRWMGNRNSDLGEGLGE